MSLDPWVATSVAELLRDATERRPVQTVDAQVGSPVREADHQGSAVLPRRCCRPNPTGSCACTGNTSYWEFQVWSGRPATTPRRR